MTDESMASGVRPRTGMERAIVWLGSLGYLGFVPAASGTVAVAAVGVPLHLALIVWLKLTWPLYLCVVIGFTLLSVFVAGATDRILNEKDSKKNVIDELPGYLIALIGMPVTWQIVVAAFLLERCIDILKIPPANHIERIPGGWGVVLDDVVAGLYTLGLLHAAIALHSGWFGL